MTTPSQMSDLVRLLSHRGLDPKQIAERTGLAPVCVDAILRGMPWRHLINRAVGDLFSQERRP